MARGGWEASAPYVWSLGDFEKAIVLKIAILLTPQLPNLFSAPYCLLGSAMPVVLKRQLVVMSLSVTSVCFILWLFSLHSVHIN